jgi:hypothetical protein
MSIYKRGGVYRCRFVFEGKRVQKSTKQGNRKASVDIESAYRTALAKGEVGIAPRKQERRTIGDLLDALKCKYKQEGKLSSQNRSLLNSTRRGFGSKMAIDLTAEDIDKYIQSRKAEGRANATVNRTIEALRSAFNIAKPKMGDSRFHQTLRRRQCATGLFRRLGNGIGSRQSSR